MFSTVGKDYGCNPMYLSQYLVDNESSFDVWWMFQRGIDIKYVDKRVKIVWFRSLKYLYILNSSEFVITNHRTCQREIFWKKRRKQKYIMTWHGSMPIKKVERDALETLGSNYEKMARKDSKSCDLMISDSVWFTNLLRNSFWYDGEILQTSLPRNLLFFDKSKHSYIRKKVLTFYNIADDSNCLVILYAPTFRTDHSINSYITNWEPIINNISTVTSKKVVVLMRLHPTLLKDVNTDSLIRESNVKNASIYNDMQELMIAADLLITDYSSTMFEFSLMKKPCVLYMPDLTTFDRDFYFDIAQLPFTKTENISELLVALKQNNTENFTTVQDFVNSNFCMYSQTNGSQLISQWMISKM